MMTTDLPEAPAYFSSDAEINRTGAAPLDQLPRPAGLSPVKVKNAKEKGDLILDVRSSGAFGAGHVPGSLNIGLTGQFASWAGSLIPLGTSIVIVAEDETGVDEAVTRLARVGIDSVRGYLNGGIYAWNQAGFETATITQMPVDELHHQIIEGADLQIVDVRRPGEFQSGHAAGARNLTLAHLVEHVAELDAERPTAVICQSGYRSSAGASLLQRLGFRQVFNVVGGTSAWIGAGYPVE